MGVDYYKLLGVKRGAKDDDLKKDVVARFKKISEAFEVLSDPQKRAIYDQYGEEGLNGQVPLPGARGAGGAPTFHFNPRSADDIFAEFFGFSGPYSGMWMDGEGGGMRGGSRSPGGMFGNDLFASGSGGEDSASMQHGPHKAAPIENQVPVSLADLYKGSTKKMKISRKIVGTSGRSTQVEEILTIDIKPGWKKGTKITFPEMGNEAPNIIPADIVFIIDEKPHDVFTREGNDLVMTENVSLVEALAGYTAHVTTLDGRNLAIPINYVIHPGYEEVIPRKGMPIPKEPSQRGNLRIKFSIKFPSRLTSDQKSGIKKLLGS